MNRGLEIIPLLLSSFLLLIAACDPEYSLCVVATSCVNDLPIAGAHVRIRAYDVDGNTDSVGKICKQQLNFRSRNARLSGLRSILMGDARISTATVALAHAVVHSPITP